MELIVEFKNMRKIEIPYPAVDKDNGELTLQSGKLELFENIINQYI